MKKTMLDASLSSLTEGVGEEFCNSCSLSQHQSILSKKMTQEGENFLYLYVYSIKSGNLSNICNCIFCKPQMLLCIHLCLNLLPYNHLPQLIMTPLH